MSILLLFCYHDNYDEENKIGNKCITAREGREIDTVLKPLFTHKPFEARVTCAI